MPASNATDERYLRMAMGKAREAARFGEAPFGAVLLYEGAVTPAMDSCVLQGDPTAHAEQAAIRDACTRHRTLALPGATLYCSTEPCAMCAGAIHWAHIDRVVYSVSQAGLQALSGGKPKAPCDGILNSGRRWVEVVGPILEGEGLAVFDGYGFKPRAEMPWRKDLLREHGISLGDDGGSLRLRPMTEADWPLIMAWNADPEVLYYSDGCDVESYPDEDLKEIYRGVSRRAYCFVTEWNGTPIGECWLQEMNLPGILAREPGDDLRRIDLMIGEKSMWGKGIGSRIIALLTQWAFDNTTADAVYGCVLDYNPRSAKAFRKAGYVLEAMEPVANSKKAMAQLNLVARRDAWLG